VGPLAKCRSGLRPRTRQLRLLPARALCTPTPLLPRPGVTH
jgi:hypothetical protein